MTTLTITRPDDWHLHLRDLPVLSSILAHTAEQFARAIVMPNLTTPITNTEQAMAYRQRICQQLPKNYNFEPLMTLYLTDSLKADEISRAVESGQIHAAKLYPAGATTNSSSGVTALKNIYPVLERMQKLGMPLLVHGEVVDPEIDIFDREAVFIDTQLIPLRRDFPELRIVFEHITTRDAADYVADGETGIAATITVHHLMYNRNALFQGGIRPHYYCLPVLKREQHRLALLQAATSGNPRYFLGTDSAPHSLNAKESACGCAGIYTAHAAMAMYATIFEACNRLDRLEAFASHFGADFYKLPRNTDTLTLEKTDWQVPSSYPLGDTDQLIPLMAGETLNWQLAR